MAADLLHFFFLHLHQIRIIKDYGSLRFCGYIREDPEDCLGNRRFPCSRFTDQGQRFSFFKLEGNAVYPIEVY